MMDRHFAHLHLHTEFSLLDGAIRLKDLVKEAQKQEWKAVGISDHGNIFGAVKFFQLAKKAGIKPILGCEMYFTPDATIKDAKEKYFHMTMVVQNNQGYRNLCNLLDFAYQDGFYFKPRIDYRMLEKHHEGLIISSGCVGGHIPTLARNGKLDQAKERISYLKDLFGKDRFFLEVSPADIEKQVITNKALFQLSDEMDVDLIATGDAHYMCKEDNEAHEILLAVGTKATMDDPNRMTFGDFKGHLKSTHELLDAFPDRPEAIWRTGEIADTIDFEFKCFPFSSFQSQ